APPWGTSKDNPFTAWTLPSMVGNVTRKASTRTIGPVEAMALSFTEAELVDAVRRCLLPPVTLCPFVSARGLCRRKTGHSSLEVFEGTLPRPRAGHGDRRSGRAGRPRGCR